MNDVGIGNVIRPEFIAGGACALLASAMVLAASAAEPGGATQAARCRR